MTPDSSVRGTDISYVSICERRAWLSIHEIYIEDGTDFIRLGKYANDFQRNYGYSQVTIGRNKIDYVQFNDKNRCIIHEFKRGRKVLDADISQISHYMNVADQNGFSVDHGEIHLLGSKKIFLVKFPLENPESLRKKYEKIADLASAKIPSPKRNYFCSHGCSYVEFCWGVL